MKKLRFVLLLMFLLTLNVSNSFSQVTEAEKNKDTKKETLTAKDYDEMTKKANRGETVDFYKMRLAYTETQQYSPYGGNQERGAMYEAVRAKNYEKAFELAEDRLKKHLVDLNALYIAALSSKQLSKTQESEFYSKILKQMLDDIFKNGDGLTAKTAIVAIGITEQYFIMSYLGFKQVSKALANENDSMFDVHTSENTETKETRKFYFNIDKVFGKF